MKRDAVLKAAVVLALCGIAAAAAADDVSSDPQVFAPGEISSTPSEECLSLTPDGDTAVYNVDNGAASIIVMAHRVNGRWSKPKIAPFSGQWVDHDPAVSPDGSFIVFASNRPATPGGKTGGGLWRVDRKGDGWGEPKRLPDSLNTTPRVYSPTVTRDGSLYFIRPDTDNIQHIFRSQYWDGTYQPPVRQMLGDRAAHEKDPGIAPDESFVVFDSDDPVRNDPDRLFIAFREGDHWGMAVDLGNGINAKNNPWGAHIGSDGHTLYYTSDRVVSLSYPQTREQAEKNLVQLQGWDNGETNIWYVSLQPWIDAHKAGKD